MPKEKMGKVSLNLKISKEMYDMWIQEAGRLKILNLSEFIRQMVMLGIQHVQ